MPAPRAGVAGGPLLAVVGARPNYVKLAPVLRALASDGIEVEVVDTGQHYDHRLAGSFEKLLGFPPIAHRLRVGSGGHARQTSAAMLGMARVLAGRAHPAVLVAGDVNSTLAAALAAAGEGVPVIHLESGLRSRDRAMPEELNRVLVDRLSSLLLCPSEDAAANLAAEGVPDERIALVGNTMIDTLRALMPAARERDAPLGLGLDPGRYALVTLHRPGTVDHPERLDAVLEALARLAEQLPVVASLHPRTRARLDAAPSRALRRLQAVDALDYLDFVGLQADARLVVTDSGGVQEETTALGVPCLTYRTSTERPVTVTHGTNRVVGNDPATLLEACEAVLAGELVTRPAAIPLWDGAAGPRAARAIAAWLAAR